MSGYTRTLPVLNDQRSLTEVRADVAKLLAQGPYAAQPKVVDRLADTYAMTIAMPTATDEQEPCGALSPGGTMRCVLESGHHWKNNTRHAIRNADGRTYFTWAGPDWVDATVPTGEMCCGKYLSNGVYCGMHQPAALVLARAAEDAANTPADQRPKPAHVAFAYETDHHICLLVVDTGTAAAGIVDMDMWIRPLELQTTTHIMDVIDSLEVPRILEFAGWELAPMGWDMVVLGNRTTHGYRIPLVPILHRQVRHTAVLIAEDRSVGPYVGVTVLREELHGEDPTDLNAWHADPAPSFTLTRPVEPEQADGPAAQQIADDLLAAGGWKRADAWERKGLPGRWDARVERITD